MGVLDRLQPIAAENRGLITRRQARLAGVHGRSLTDLVRHGVIARIARGVYAVADRAQATIDPRGDHDRVARRPQRRVGCRLVGCRSAGSGGTAARDGPSQPTSRPRRRPRDPRAPRDPSRRRGGDGSRRPRHDPTADGARHRPAESARARRGGRRLVLPGRAPHAGGVRRRGFGRTGPGAGPAAARRHAVRPGKRIRSWSHARGSSSGVITSAPERTQFPLKHPHTGWIGYLDFAWPEPARRPRVRRLRVPRRPRAVPEGPATVERPQPRRLAQRRRDLVRRRRRPGYVVALVRDLLTTPVRRLPAHIRDGGNC